MITKSIQLIKNMGSRYFFYRVKHELEKRTGVLKKRHTINPLPRHFISLADWKSNTPGFVIKEQANMNFPKEPLSALQDQTRKILGGEICFFSSEWKPLGANYDWITNPDSGYRYDIAQHWSEISDLNPVNGDIKYVWEKSRFSYLLTIIRNDYHFEEDHSEFVFAEIESWIDANPINQGPNWRCSQEISLRIMNWCYALYFYKDSKMLTEELWDKIQNLIYWSLHHVYNHIDFSRIAVRNNHAITETLMLTISNLLFPFIPETKHWSTKGRKWFEEEIAYQIYEDGTFLQFSMNYHRVVIQLLSFGIALTEQHHQPFSDLVYDRAYKSVDFLYQCLQEENGYLPNYGSNDGALFFPFVNSQYRDYRPQLNTLHKILTGKHLYRLQEVLEDSFWLSANDVKEGIYKKLALIKRKGTISYPVGGYYLLREEETFTFIRCGNHKDRPAHADNLHLDIWIKGENILRDSGTYKYNTEKELQDYFTGTYSHNTVMLADNSQMMKGSRFIWYYWTQAISAEWKEEQDKYIFEGTISAFRFLNPKATHQRRVVKLKDRNEWIVNDKVFGLPQIKKNQLWHHDQFAIDFSATEHENIEANTAVSYNSDYYGLKDQGLATCFSFDEEITTTISIDDK